MTKRNKKERQGMIRRMLAEQGSIPIKALRDHFDVTTMTIRRDLEELEEKGLLVRTFGACQIVSPMAQRLSFNQKDHIRSREKAAIALEATKLIRPLETVYIDSGTTCLHFARILPPDLKLRIFTNNLRVIMDLHAREEFEVIAYGGRLDRAALSLGGEIALSRIQDFRVDTAVFGADAIDVPRREIYGAPDVSPVTFRILEAQSSRQIVLADSSKFNKRGYVMLGKLRPGIILVTDDDITPADFSLLKDSGVDIIVAKKQS